MTNSDSDLGTGLIQDLKDFEMGSDFISEDLGLDSDMIFLALSNRNTTTAQ